MSGRRDDLSELRAALAAGLQSWSEALLGPRNRKLSNRREWRWGSKGALSVVVSGADRGGWIDHDSGQFGGPLDLVMFAGRLPFPEAVDWARRAVGGSAELAQFRPAPRDHASDDRARGANEAARIELARAIWATSVPIAGTMAERYLTAARAIPAPAGGWPDAVRFHAPSRSLVAVATTAAGDIVAIQRVRLTPDGSKDTAATASKGAPPGVAKPTTGVLSGTGAAVRLPGDPAGPVYLVEGTETGLTVWTATGCDVLIGLGKGNLPNVELPPGRRVVLCAEYGPHDGYLPEAVAAWRAAGHAVAVAWPWATRPANGNDLNDLLQQDGIKAVRLALANARSTSPAAPAPHYARPALAFDTASARLRRIVAAWLNRVELHLAARDWMAAETARLLPEMVEQSEARILARLVRQNMGMEAAEELAQERAKPAGNAMAKQRARRAAAIRFGKRAATGAMPRVQVKAAAGLGKTRAIIDEYVKRPALWGRHINVFVRDLKLASDFMRDVTAAAAEVLPAQDGSRPRVMVIQGRNQPGMCHPERQPLTEQAAKHVDSVYRACCKTPAADGALEVRCPFYSSCAATGYIGQFKDTAPALRLFAHQRLGTSQPNDLRLPVADLVIVDESCMGALVKAATCDPARLTDHRTYTAPAGAEHLIQEAMDAGRAVVAALSGQAPAVETLRAQGIMPEHLRAAARSASAAADMTRPAIHAGMTPDAARARLAQHKPHHGRAVAAVLAQLARDLESGRAASTGVEWDAAAKATTEAGERVPHPTILWHGLTAAQGAPAGTALMVLDADADLEINRRLFGADLRGLTINTVRQTYVVQVVDAALSTSSIAPASALPNNQDKAKKLRAKIGELVRREAEGGRKVLVVSTLPVRRALAGETDKLVPVSVSWQGAELTHFGRHLGANQWSHFDTVVVIGREQLPPLAAERIARAIYADAPDVDLSLTGTYGRQDRRHDLRTGDAELVAVQAHADRRVQAVVEMGRENGMGQAVDRLRPVRRDPGLPVRVIALSNLPVPGLVVDQLMSLDDVLAGGTLMERALAAMPGGVLPLSPDWLTANLADLFPSRRTAARWAAGVKCQPAIGDLYCQMALYSLAGQFRPSRALIRSDVNDPRGELEMVLGAQVLDFKEIKVAPEIAAPMPQAGLSAPDEPAVMVAPMRWQNRRPGEGNLERLWRSPAWVAMAREAGLSPRAGPW